MPGPLLSAKDSTINRNDKSTYPGGREAVSTVSEVESTPEDGRCYGGHKAEEAEWTCSGSIFNRMVRVGLREMVRMEQRLTGGTGVRADTWGRAF